MLTKQVSDSYNLFTHALLELFESPYLNLGYWDKKEMTIFEAQLTLVQQFGEFSKMNKDAKVLDLGCGTGEQDINFMELYSCKHITGVNNSKIQIQIALKRLNEVSCYKDKVDFLLENAENLSSHPKECYDRVLALESSQHFDKKAFFEGSYHVLKPKGYLCIAEVIRKKQFILTQSSLSEIEKQLPLKGGLRKLYKFKLKKIRELVLAALEEEQRSVNTYENRKIGYKEYLLLLQRTGFLIDEIKDVTKKVSGFYKVVQKRIVEILQSCYPYVHPNSDVLIYVLIVVYFLYKAFLMKESGFYLIRAVKK